MRVPAGNRLYPRSIATTWSISFFLLSKCSARLLRIFAFLNPDGILIPFLASEAEALEGATTDDKGILSILLNEKSLHPRTAFFLTPISSGPCQRDSGYRLFHVAFQVSAFR